MKKKTDTAKKIIFEHETQQRSFFCHAVFNEKSAAELESQINVDNLKCLIDSLDHSVHIFSNKKKGKDWRGVIVLANHSRPFQIELGESAHLSAEKTGTVDKIVWHLDSLEMMNNFKKHFKQPSREEAFMALMPLPALTVVEINNFLKEDFHIYKEKTLLTHEIQEIEQIEELTLLGNSSFKV